MRVDWFTPDGLPIWGDGRITHPRHRGLYRIAEICRHRRPAPASDHLFIVDGKGVRHIDCSSETLPYGKAFLEDVRNRTETAMGQAHCFKAMELALTAQAMAEGSVAKAKSGKRAAARR